LFLFYPHFCLRRLLLLLLLHHHFSFFFLYLFTLPFWLHLATNMAAHDGREMCTVYYMQASSKMVHTRRVSVSLTSEIDKLKSDTFFRSTG
jgi:hypothetical protein